MKNYRSGALLALVMLTACTTPAKPKPATKNAAAPKAILTKTSPFYFNSFVDCNMAEAWVGDTFRIFPGKYGEDPLWGAARDLKFADGRNADEAFHRAQRISGTSFAEKRYTRNAGPARCRMV